MQVIPRPNSPDISESFCRTILWISGQFLSFERTETATCIYRKRKSRDTNLAENNARQAANNIVRKNDKITTEIYELQLRLQRR